MFFKRKSTRESKKNKRRRTDEECQRDKVIGENITKFRKIAGISQQKLADELGIAFQQVQKYEKGTNATKTSRLISICKVLGVSLYEIIPNDTENDNRVQEFQQLYLQAKKKKIDLATLLKSLS